MAYRRIEIPQDVSDVLDALWRHGYPAYVVGGCVRDSLAARVPSDWDVCTAARPDQMRRVFEGEKLIATGEKHGTMTLVRRGVPYEITTFRADGDYGDARHPDRVRFGVSLTEDLARRDFTVNAMAYSHRSGLVDAFDGLADLRGKKLRCVGDPSQRFAEDALRIARAVRLVAQLGFSVEKNTERAASELCGRLVLVSPERVCAELEKLLCGEYAGSALRLYGAWLAAVLPVMPDWTGSAVAACPADSDVRLAVLTHACGPGFLDTLRFPRAQTLAAAAIAAYLDTPPEATAEAARRTLHRLGARGAQAYAAARAAVCSARGDREGAVQASAFWRETESALARGDCYSLAQLAVNGADALTVGVTPGRAVGKALAHLLDGVMRGDLPNDRQTLLDRLRMIAQERRD